MRIAATVTLGEAVETDWDVVVIGAGPAGAVAARQLARRGRRTLLVDRAAFPRRKVCGGYLNGRAVFVLKLLGLEAILSRLHATPLHEFCIASRGRCAAVPLPGGVGVTRAALDAELVRAAIAAGASFLPQTSAALGDVARAGRAREVHLVPHGRTAVMVPARLAVVADGLARSSLQHHPEFPGSVAARCRVGLGTLVDQAPAGYRAGTIFMAVAETGYVGLVRLEDGRLNVAAALDPEFVRRCRRPGHAPAAIVQQAGFPAPPGLAAADWRGTGPLTRSTLRPAAHRVLVLGDAAGYVEPFTGEGIAWALTGAVAAAGLVPHDLANWDKRVSQQWVQLYRWLVLDRQRWCRRLAWLTKQPRSVRAALVAVSHFPGLARPIVRHLTELPTSLPSLAEGPSTSFDVAPARSRSAVCGSPVARRAEQQTDNSAAERQAVKSAASPSASGVGAEASGQPTERSL